MGKYHPIVALAVIGIRRGLNQESISAGTCRLLNQTPKFIWRMVGSRSSGFIDSQVIMSIAGELVARAATSGSDSV